MSEKIVRLQKPHKAQEEILTKARRFNHLRCGRRFGKTSLIEELSSISLEKKKTGVWFPTYKDLSEVWKDILYTYRNVILKKDEQIKQIRLLTGGIIDFWSMDDPDSGQGRGYHRAIIDEAAKAKKLYQAWEETIRPTLTDYQGDAWILSRPKGFNNGFYELEHKHKGFKNWAFFHYTTYDNPFILTSEIEDARSQLDHLTFEQEYMAEYVDMNNMPFLYNFDRDKHVSDCGPIEGKPVLLSFDFNLEPFAVLVYQEIPNGLKFFDRVRLNNSDIYQVCDAIRASYPGAFFVVTGDRSGYNRTGTVRGKTSYWQIIKQELRLSSPQIKLRSKNLDLIESRVLCNSALKTKNITIDPSLKELIRDCLHASVDDKGELIKDRSKNQNDFLDCFRYSLDAKWPELTRKP